MNNETKNYFGQRINIEIGTNLSIEIDGIDGKLKSSLIGLLPSEYIIIKGPIGYSGVRDKLYENNRVIVRYLNHGEIYGFQSYIINLINKPKAILILDYPQQIYTVSMRKQIRQNCFLTAKLKIGDQTFNGTIVDISESGCRCLLPILNENIQKKFTGEHIEAELAFNSPIDDDEISVVANVANFTIERTVSKIGIKFILDDEFFTKIEKIVAYLERN